MKLPTLTYIGPMHLDGPRTFTLPAAPDGCDDNPHDELLVRSLQDRANSLVTGHIAKDNQGSATNWSKDQDPAPGRLLRTLTAPAHELQGKTANVALSLTFEPGAQPQPVCMTMLSDNGNYESRLQWEQGVLVRDFEKRVLADGRVETLELTVDPKTGALRYEQNVS